MRQRPRTGWIPVGLLFLTASVRPAAALEVQVIGRLTDGNGGAISGATVFLSAVLEISPERTEVLKSKADGSFASRLKPGRYRVAALKPGYEIAMTEVHTLAHPVFELRMRESSDIRLGNLPVGSAGENLGTGWILRRQHSDVLRAEEPGLPVMVARTSGDEGGPGSAAGLPPASRGPAGATLASIDGEFEQRWGRENLFGNREYDHAGVGRSTALALRGAMGDRGHWSFDGWLDRTSAEAESAGRVERRADQVTVGMDYALGPRDGLAAAVQYGTGRYVVGTGREASRLTEQELRVAGLFSRWDRALGAGSGLYAEAGYVEAEARLPDPDGSPLAHLSGLAADRSRVTNRTWLGGAGVALEEGNHQINLAVRARGYRYDLIDQGVLLSGLGRTPSFTEGGATGGVLSLAAGDRWRVSESSRLDYGVAYHTARSSGDGYIVPSVGMTWTPPGDGGMTFRSALTLRLDETQSTSPQQGPVTDGTGPRLETDRLGYRIGFERRRPDRLQIAATLSYSPFEADLPGTRVDPGLRGWSEAPLFLADGAARHHRLGLELAHDFGALRGGVEGTVGRVAGRVTPAMEDAPVQILADGQIHYYRAQAWARYRPTETELQIDYREVRGGAEAFTGLDYRQVDLVIYQDIPGLRSLGNARLRLLMAYQGLMYGSLYDGADEAPTPGSASRVTGGVRILF